MTNGNACRIGLAALLGLAMSAGSAVAGEEKLKPDDLPKAVRKAVEKKFPEAKIRGAAKEVEDGKTTYEVEMTVKGRSVDVAMDAKGRILEIEKEIAVSKLPKKVREELQEKFPGAKIEKAEEITRGEGGPTRYEVAIKAEVVLTAEGKVVRDREEDDEDEHAEASKGEGKKKEHEDEDDDEEHERHSAKGKEKKEHKESASKGEGEKKEHEDDDDR